MSSDQDVQREIEQLEQRFAENSRGLVFAHLADAYRRAHEYAKAEGLILHGLKNHPSYISAYNVLGRIYLDSDRLADAHEQFTRVLELDPHNLIALRALGDLAARAGHADEARSWYEQMLQVDPRNDAVREEIRKLSEQEREGDGTGSEAGGQPETTPADASDAASTTHPGPMPEMAGAPTGEEGREASPEERGLEAGALGIMDSGDLGELVDEVPDVLAEETDARSLEAMPWEDIRDVSSLDLEAGAEIDQGTADRTAVEPEEVEAEHIDSVDAEVEERLEALVEPEGQPEEEGPEEEARPGTPHDQEHVVDLTDLDDWTPGLFEGEPKGEVAETGAAELEADNFIDALERGFDPEAEAVEEEPATPRQGVPGGGLVTETMAELYARQGLHAEALRVYRQLAESRPGQERLQRRIAELEAKLVPELESESTDEAELLELLDITGMTEKAGERIADEEDEAGAVGGLDLESASDAPTEAMAGPTADTREEGPTETETEDREAEPALEDVTTAAAFAGALDEPSGDGEFEFADEVPVAGLEQLDPFAASFEVIGRGEGREAEEVGVDVPSAHDEDEGEVSVADAGLQEVDRGETAAALAGMTSLEPEEPPGAEDEVAAEIGGPAGAGQAEPEGSEEGDVAETAGETPPEGSPTIERYLFELLDFDSESPGADAGSNPVSRPRSEAQASPSRDSKPETRPAGTEDLEQFQEWLRGLRH